MESDILNLDSALSLTEEEATSVVIPQSDWDKGVDGYRFTLVGHLLSHRLIHFEALKVRLIQLIQAARGVTVRKLLETRFCWVFNHEEDLRQALDMRPWIIDRNLVVLQPLSQPEDPLSISLDWCPFFVHIHDLRLGQRSVDVLRYIGNYVGVWLDAANIERDISWFENVRNRLNINVSIPLKRALRIQLDTGASCIVRFSYERLPNFCYLCGKLGHISRFCDLRFQDGYVDLGANCPFGAWLRAPGRMQRVGGTTDSILPTYVWSSHQTTTSSSDQRRGA
ncbi:hypothetical protein Salat_2234500 [Sesamum alatum]|uniref:CCHC-type domain-containing protein n=1 Tax=Sesamum alatum TaxID=300844 RepID=A0AAE2CDI6_9LAMI|nr:hypothetical protein Salat_2234500 [Sesamum alatum]